MPGEDHHPDTGKSGDDGKDDRGSVSFQFFGARPVFREHPIGHKNAVIDTKTKDETADYDVENIELDVKKPHDSDGQEPGQENRYTGDKGQRKTSIGEIQNQ